MIILTKVRFGKGLHILSYMVIKFLTLFVEVSDKELTEVEWIKYK